MKASDIMVESVIKVSKDSSLEDVAKLLMEHKISGVPVVDEEDRVIGMVTEGDLVFQNKKLTPPAFTEILGAIIYLEDLNDYRDRWKKMIATNVEDLMSTEIITIERDTEMSEIASIMVDKGINRLPVVDADKKIVGIISRQDIVKSLIRE